MPSRRGNFGKQNAESRIMEPLFVCVRFLTRVCSATVLPPFSILSNSFGNSAIRVLLSANVLRPIPGYFPLHLFHGQVVWILNSGRRPTF